MVKKVFLTLFFLYIFFFFYSFKAFPPIKQNNQTLKLLQTNTNPTNFKSSHQIPLTLDKKKFLVEVADTPEKRKRGLMHRKNLCLNCGMLFIFPQEEKLSFWMKNTLIPLDIVFINQKKRIVDLTTLSPCELNKPCIPYSTPKPAQYVLEVNAETFSNIIGKKVKF